MNRAFVCSLASMFALVLSGAASAGVIINGIWSPVKEPPFAAPDAALQGFQGYLLTATTTEANEVISAVDISLRGTFHQRWIDSDDDGVFEPTPSGNATSFNGDSRLTPIAGALIGAAPTEDNSGTGSPLADTATRDYGLGTTLTGAWGIPGASQTTSVNLAYIVVPGSNVMYVMDLAVATSMGTYTYTILGAWDPEPASAVLLALGSLMFATRWARPGTFLPQP
jgi:hypothetical protein